jgi:hypothetical protein
MNCFGYSVTQITCSTEKVKEDNLSNLRFEVEDTSCDVTAKDEAIRIYVKDTTIRWQMVLLQMEKQENPSFYL